MEYSDMIDIHTHLLPYVDDGASSWEEALKMARIAELDGIRYMVCTPHLDSEGCYNTELDRHTSIRIELQRRLEDAGVGITLLAGAEWKLSPQILESVSTGGRLGEGKAFLFELSRYMSFSVVELLVHEATQKGFIPVVAHPERFYGVEGKGTEQFAGICSAGGLLQLTAGSLIGHFGNDVRKRAESLANRFSSHIVIASDAHGSSVRIPQLKEGYRALEMLSGGLANDVRVRTNNLLFPD